MRLLDLPLGSGQGRAAHSARLNDEHRPGIHRVGADNPWSCAAPQCPVPQDEARRDAAQHV